MKYTIFLLGLLNVISLGSFDKIQNLLDKSKKTDSTELAELYVNISKEYYSVSNNNESEIYAHKALKLAERLNQHDIEIEAMILIGKNDEIINHGKNTITIYMEALAKAKEINNEYLIGLTQNRIGQFYYSLCLYDQAMKYFYDALHIAEDKNFKELESMIINNIGIIFYVNGDLDSALEQFLKSNMISDQLKKEDPTSLNNIGLVHWMQGDLDKSLDLFQQSMEINKKNHNFKEVSTQLNNIGLVYRDMNKLTTSLTWFEQSLKISKKINDKHGEINSLINISGVYMEQKKFDQAKEILNKALKESKESNYKDYLLECYKGLALTSTFENDFERALDFTHKQMALHSSIFNEKKNRDIAQLNNAYELEKKQEQIDILESEKSMHLILWGGLSVLCVVIAISVYISLSSKNKLLRQNNDILKQKEEINSLQLDKISLENEKRAQENILLQKDIEARNKAAVHQKEKYDLELEHKNKELSTIALMVNNKNDIISQICDKLTKLSGDFKVENRKKINAMIREVKNSIDTDKEWDTFKKHFEEVHNDFFDKLLSQSSALTANDLKLCAYMRINVSTKEISRILNISPAAVNQRRYRIREKLDIPQEITLFEYMSKV
jgi:tetratricopeptide (TPR) repeat protein